MGQKCYKWHVFLQNAPVCALRLINSNANNLIKSQIRFTGLTIKNDAIEYTKRWEFVFE